MAQPIPRRRLLGPALATLLLVILVTRSAAAQEPTAPTDLDIPAPEECAVEPRPLPPFDSAPAASPTPAATTDAPFTPPPGLPADRAITAAVVATVREAIACANAGDVRRQLALFSDAYLRRQFSGPAAADPQAVADLLAAEPEPADRDTWLPLLAVADVRVFADGRAGAVVLTGDPEQPFRDFLFFVRAGDRWLIDASVALDEGPATPPG